MQEQPLWRLFTPLRRLTDLPDRSLPVWDLLVAVSYADQRLVAPPSAAWRLQTMELLLFWGKR